MYGNVYGQVAASDVVGMRLCVPVVWLQVCESGQKECLFLTVSAKPSIGDEHARVSVPVRVRACGCGRGVNVGTHGCDNMGAGVEC